MSPCENGPESPGTPETAETSAEDARIRTGVALALVELAAQVLEELPSPELAFRRGDPGLFRYLQAAEAMRAWLVGLGEGDNAEHPGRGSALGDGARIYRWSEAEADRHFRSAFHEWRARQ